MTNQRRQELQGWYGIPPSLIACIYGVDVNPLAVELAKLSLWLATLSRGKPLSFLDHHVQCGNTLIGARVSEIGALSDERKRKSKKAAEVQEAAGQLTLFNEADFAPTMSFAIDQMNSIEHTLADSVDQVKRQEQMYAALTTKLSEWRRTADAWTARHFGIAFDRPTWDMVSKYLRGKLMSIPPLLRDLADKADTIAQIQHFFHWELVFPEVFFAPDGTPKENPGFDAIVGNPPYVRQEFIQPIKDYLAANYAPIYSGTADLYVYFYGRGLGLLRRGGSLSYITANKWFRAGYGEGLRGFLAENALVREIVDFGHAPIFKGADTFPAILVIDKPDGDSAQDTVAQVTSFPRQMLKTADLKEYTRDYGHGIPRKRFGATTWSLERLEVDLLMDKIHVMGMPLTGFAGNRPYRGFLTGFNDAFLIDTPTRDRLIQEDTKCATLIKPYLRGQDIKRWSPEWAEEWLILLKSSENFAWPWHNMAEDAESLFEKTYPSVYRFMKGYESKLRNREDHGRYWWELRSCAYYDAFDHAKLIYQVIQYHPLYCLDKDSYFANDKCFILPTMDMYLLAVLNSTLMWWHNWHYLGHMKDEALTPLVEKMVSLPIAPPTDAIRAEVEPAVRRLIDLTRSRREHLHEVLNWLRIEYGVEKPGQKLEAFTGLNETEFVEAVKDRRPKNQKLTPAGLHLLTQTYHDYAAQIGQIDTEADRLERRLSDLVNQAYGLTAEEIDLMWRTAPPRMPFTKDRNADGLL